MGGINCLFTIIPHGEGVNESKLLARSSGPGNLLEMILCTTWKWEKFLLTHACMCYYLPLRGDACHVSPALAPQLCCDRPTCYPRQTRCVTLANFFFSLLFSPQWQVFLSGIRSRESGNKEINESSSSPSCEDESSVVWLMLLLLLWVSVIAVLAQHMPEMTITQQTSWRPSLFISLPFWKINSPSISQRMEGILRMREGEGISTLIFGERWACWFQRMANAKAPIYGAFTPLQIAQYGGY